MRSPKATAVIIAIAAIAAALTSCTVWATPASSTPFPTVTVTVTAAPQESSPVPAITDIPGLPPFMEGQWCTRAGPQDCFDEEELLADYPAAYVSDTFAEDGAIGYAICLVKQRDADCSMAGQYSLLYFPAGVSWNCKSYIAGTTHYPDGTEGPPLWTKCDPDYTSAHDSSQPRLVNEPNHQQGDAYEDSPPMYRSED